MVVNVPISKFTFTEQVLFFHMNKCTNTIVVIRVTLICNFSQSTFATLEFRDIVRLANNSLNGEIYFNLLRNIIDSTLNDVTGNELQQTECLFSPR